MARLKLRSHSSSFSLAFAICSLLPLSLEAAGFESRVGVAAKIQTQRADRARTRLGTSRALARQKSITTEDFNSLAVPVLVLVSCPMERKVSYTVVAGKKVGDVEPLIDSGLSSPHGLAYFPKESILYVADMGDEKIFSYKIAVYKSPGPNPYRVAVTGVQTLIVQQVRASWLALDSEGSLYFTDQQSNSVNRIDKAVLEKLRNGDVLATDLQFTTAQELQAMEQAAASPDLDAAGKQRAEELTQHAQETTIESIYQADEVPHISVPAGIITDDLEVYWTNQADGVTAGSVVSGLATAHKGSETIVIANRTNSAYGIALTDSLILFTDQKQFIYGVKKVGGDIISLSDQLFTPRGIAWDGGQTAFVADAGGNAVYSLPVGYLATNQPLDHMFDVHDPFDVALITVSDPAFAQVLPAQAWSGAAPSHMFGGRLWTYDLPVLIPAVVAAMVGSGVLR